MAIKLTPKLEALRAELQEARDNYGAAEELVREAQKIESDVWNRWKTAHDAFILRRMKGMLGCWVACNGVIEGVAIKGDRVEVLHVSKGRIMVKHPTIKKAFWLWPGEIGLEAPDPNEPMLAMNRVMAKTLNRRFEVVE